MAFEPFATVQDVIDLWRHLTSEEIERTEHLLVAVSDSLRTEAYRVGKDLDQMKEDFAPFATVLKSVTVDVIARTLLTSTTDEPMTQQSQSALGYSWSGSYLVPGGGLFIKNSELARLGLRRQQIGTIEMYGDISKTRWPYGED